MNQRNVRFTTGLCDILDDDRNKRLCFFEVDELGNSELYFRVCDNYRKFCLDYLVHRTMCGWHWLSPTILDVATWKEFHKNINDINKKCPMTCMRWLPDKYPDETLIWYLSMAFYHNPDYSRNNLAMCTLLNHVFRTHFVGRQEEKLKFVRYPLPLVRL